MRVMLFLANLGAAAPVAAQLPPQRPIQIVVSGGFQLPTGSFADYHDLGVHADVALSVRAGGMRLRPELTYSRFNLKESFTLPSILSQRGAAAGGMRAGPYDDALSTLLGGFANLELPLSQGSFQPFLLAGVGAVSLSSDATLDADALKDVKASISLGAGIRFRLGSIMGLIEARLNNVPTDDARAFFKDVRTVPVTFGLVF